MVRLHLDCTRRLPILHPAPPRLALRRASTSSRAPAAPPSSGFTPITRRPAFASSVLLAGVGLGAGAGTLLGQAAKTRTPRSHALWTLRCDEAHGAAPGKAPGGSASAAEENARGRAGRKDDDDKGFLDKIKSLSMPDLPSAPSLPDFPKLPDLSLPSIRLTDVTQTLNSWSSSLSSVSETFSRLQDELTLGPDSTYARIIDQGKDTKLHPELQWDAKVRLGTDLPLSERAFLRNRRSRMREAFARLVDVPLEEVDERDLPTVSIAASGGGYRAMLNTMASLEAAKETGLWDVVTAIAGVSGSCWALNTLYSLGGGAFAMRPRSTEWRTDCPSRAADISWTLQHLRERVKEPFLQPDTFTGLLNVDDPNSRAILTSTILKKASQGGDISLVDVYGVLVSTRLYLPSPSLPPPPRPLSLRALKTSAQRDFIDDGGAPLPIYTTVRHDIPPPAELEKAEKESEDKAKEIVQKAEYTWCASLLFSLPASQPDTRCATRQVRDDAVRGRQRQARRVDPDLGARTRL